MALTWNPDLGGRAGEGTFWHDFCFILVIKLKFNAAQIILLAIYVEKYHSYICIANSSIWTYLILPICEIALKGGMHSYALIILISWL